MKKILVCIYGGTDLQNTPSGFIEELTYAILSSFPSKIITGGFRHSNEKPNAISTDVSALNGALRYAKEKGVKLEECFEAWVPEPTLDDRSDVKGAVRMREEEGIKVQIMEGLTPLGRRLTMVASVDIVITISGRRHTEVVVEQALELGIPVLPIPHAEGDSGVLFKKYHDRIADFFAPGALDACIDELDQKINTDEQAAAQATVELIQTAKFGMCLALFPYDPAQNQLYDSTIEPAITKHMTAMRLDHLSRSEAIYNSFADTMRKSLAVIADITQLNENVMYEIGFAHALGITPLLYTREASRIDELPVYFRTLNIRVVSEVSPLADLIDEYLRSFKRRSRQIKIVEPLGTK